MIPSEGRVAITINLKPEVEAELARRAESLGMDVSAYAAVLLEQATKLSQSPVTDVEAFEKSLDRLAQFSDKIPALPDEAFSRESIYWDHD